MVFRSTYGRNDLIVSTKMEDYDNFDKVPLTSDHYRPRSPNKRLPI